MSRLSGKREPDLIKYDQMSVEELREIIREDALEDGYSTANEDTIRYILEVLLNREMRESVKRNIDVGTAWQQFQKDYQPYANSFENLYEDVDEIKQHGHRMSKVHGEVKRERPRLFQLLSRAVAVMVIVICCGTFVTNALGLNLGEILAHWTDELFSFYTHDESAPVEYDDIKIKKTLEKYDIPSGCFPTWHPWEYKLNEMQVNPSDDNSVISFLAVYHNDSNGDEYLVSVKNLSYDTPSVFEKDDSAVKVYEKDGIMYYINSNLDSVSTVWQYKNFECSIISELPYDDLIKIIESIQ